MDNFNSKGLTITATVANNTGAVALASGDGYLVGTIFGVAAGAAAVGATVVLNLRGVFTLPKNNPGETWAQGAALYWDNTAGEVTTTSGGNTLIGKAYAAAADGDTTGQVLLTENG